MSTLDTIKDLREKTGAGIVEVKKAFAEAGGDETKAIDILRKNGQAKALKKSDREANEGVIGSYMHSNGKVGSMVKVACETDFVARNDDFQAFAKDVAMHVTAMNPLYLSPSDVSDDMVAKEREVWIEQLKDENKPQEIMDKILEGKEKKFREEVALLTQPFVKDPDRTIGELLTETVTKIGENVQITDFVRFEL